MQVPGAGIADLRQLGAGLQLCSVRVGQGGWLVCYTYSLLLTLRGFYPVCVFTFPSQIRGYLGKFILMNFCTSERRVVPLVVRISAAG